MKERPATLDAGAEERVTCEKESLDRLSPIFEATRACDSKFGRISAMGLAAIDADIAAI